MRIAYLIPENLNAHPGLKYKVENQVSRWSTAGHEVYLVHLALGYAEMASGEKVREERTPNHHGLGMVSRFKNLSWSYGFARRILAEIRPDITYTRYLFPALNINEIGKLAGSLICEINSDDRKEFRSKNCISGSYNALLRNAFLSQVDGFVFMTDELGCSSSFTRFDRPACTIPNGANIDDFPFLESTGNPQPNLVFVGSPGQSWHGLDKILRLARRLDNCRFHIVGPSRQECQAVWLELPENAEFHGYLTGEGAGEVVSRADVGIGTLALHRKGMSEACPLKVRQYLAQGVPVIAGYKDPDIHEASAFYLEISNHESNVEDSLEDIVRFVDCVYKSDATRFEARRFAEERLSLSAKEEKRLAFFQQVLNS